MNRRSLLKYLGLAPLAAVVPAAATTPMTPQEYQAAYYARKNHDIRMRQIEVLRDMIDADRRKVVDDTGRLFEPFDLEIWEHKQVCELELARLERKTRDEQQDVFVEKYFGDQLRAVQIDVWRALGKL